MSQTPFATAEDVATRLGRDLSETEAASVDFLLEGATAIITAELGQPDDWAPNPVPVVLKTITVEMVCRVFTNPLWAQRETKSLGQFSHTVDFRSQVPELGLMPYEIGLLERVFTLSSSTFGSIRTPTILT